MSNEHPPHTLIVLASGSGSNLQAIIDAIAAEQLHAQIKLVVANRRDAFALKRAEQAHIPTLYFPLKPYKDAGKNREAYDADLAAILRRYASDLIVLAGWMHVFSPAFLDAFVGKVINLHPALPGAFAGTDAIARAFAAYQRGEITHSGCMMHYVAPAVDAGPVIAQRSVPFEVADTLETFEARMHTAEHALIVDAIRQALDVDGATVPPGR
jgi:formyltetrahydrofolate-dependent phosphoribosylglycinamide formyltransferase